MTEIAADKRQLRFLRIDVLDTAYTLNGFLLVDITTQAVNGIGRINDHAPGFQAFGYLLDQPGLGVFRMYADEHLR